MSPALRSPSRFPYAKAMTAMHMLVTSLMSLLLYTLAPSLYPSMGKARENWRTVSGVPGECKQASPGSKRWCHGHGKCCFRHVSPSLWRAFVLLFSCINLSCFVYVAALLCVCWLVACLLALLCFALLCFALLCFALLACLLACLLF